MPQERLTKEDEVEFEGSTHKGAPEPGELGYAKFALLTCLRPSSFSVTTVVIWMTKLNMRAANTKGPKICRKQAAAGVWLVGAMVRY